jgi:DNA-binding GntR family transcriptional regulator
MFKPVPRRRGAQAKGQSMGQLVKAFYEDRIYETLRSDIVRGVYTFGEKLDIQKLTMVFGVSRSPVVQAITRLEHEGLVFIRPNVGSFVFDPTPQDIREIIQLRRALELCALELAFEAMDDSFSDAVQAILDKVGEETLETDPELFFQSDRNFHDAFFVAAGNERLRGTMTALRGQIEIFRVGSFSKEAALESMNYHQSIADALRARDLPKARELLTAHLKVTGKFAQEILKSAHAAQKR